MSFSLSSPEDSRSPPLSIPTLDLQDYFNPLTRSWFLETLERSLSEGVGFFLEHIGVDERTIQCAAEQIQFFFHRDLAFKRKSQDLESFGQRGFTQGETAKGYSAKDRKEFYQVGRELIPEQCVSWGIRPNVWPVQKGFKEALTTLYEELERPSRLLFQAIVEIINNRNTANTIEANFFEKMTEQGDAILRAAYYPPFTEEALPRDESIFWAAPHTDIDLLTLSPFVTCGGLQVEKDGVWYNVPPPLPGQCFVQVGDMLENITNGLFKSVRHRVQALEADQERFALLYFTVPEANARLDPLPVCIEKTGGLPRHAKGTCNEFLWERLLELGLGTEGLWEFYARTGHTERQAAVGRASPRVLQQLVAKGLASQELLKALAERCCANR